MTVRIPNASTPTAGTSLPTAGAVITRTDQAAVAFRAPRYSAMTMLDPAFGITSTSTPASGTVWATKLPLLKDDTVSGLGCFCSAVGAGVSDLRFMLLDASRKVLGYTANLSSGLAAAEVFGAFTDSGGSGASVPIPAAGAHYFAVLAVYATTAPAFRAFASSTGITNLAPARSGNSTTGLTGPPAVGTTLAAITGNAGVLNGGAY
jgi:hypothetical protein